MRPTPFSGTLRVAERLLRLAVPYETARAVIGDLAEDLAAGTHRYPRAWLVGQLIRHAAAGFWTRLPELASFGSWTRAGRYALRSWRRQPATAALVVLVLGIAVGANTTFFSLTNALLWRPLRLERPGQLVAVGEATAGGHQPSYMGLTYGSLALLREIQVRQPAFGSTACYLGGRLTLEIAGEIRQVPSAFVSGDFFSVIGGQAIVGRLLEPSDDGPTASSTAHVAVIGSRFWQSAFQADSHAIGQPVLVEGVPFTIVGVAPERILGLQVEAMNDLVIPASTEPELFHEPDTASSATCLPIVGRLRDGVSIDAARRELETDWPAVTAALPVLPSSGAGGPSDHTHPTVTSIETGLSFLRGQYESMLQLLMGLASTLILVACLSVGGVLAAGTVARLPEFHVRLALGASRADLARQLFAESAVVCVAGSVIGTGVASWAARPVLNWLWPNGNPQDVNLAVDWHVLTVTVATLAVAIFLAGVVPAWLASRAHPTASLTLRTVSNPRGRWQTPVLVVQLAFTLALLAGAGLFVRTLAAKRPTVPGPPLTHLWEARLLVAPNDIVNRSDAAYYATLTERLSAVPGVSAVALAGLGPYVGLAARSPRPMHLTGSAPSANDPLAITDFVSPGFFNTIGVPILEGREFEWTDVNLPPVTVLSASLAHRLFPDNDAVGRRVQIGRNLDVRVVGVAGDTRYQDIREAHPLAAYLLNSAVGATWGCALVRVQTSTLSIDTLNRVLQPLRHEQVSILRTFAQEENNTLLPERLAASFGTFFAVLAGLLAAVGLYGRLSLLVTQRRRELAIQLALGASPDALRRSVLGAGLRIAALSVAVGLPLSVALARFARSELTGLVTTDSSIFGLAIVVLFAVALAASYLPARRALSANPLETLRSQ